MFQKTKAMLQRFIGFLAVLFVLFHLSKNVFIILSYV